MTRRLLYILFLFIPFGNVLFLNAQDSIKTVYISNEKEFVNALDDNTEIIIKTDTLDFTQDYLEKLLGSKPYENYFVPAKKVFFENGIVLHGFDNLSIIGRPSTHIITTDPDEHVFTLENCSNIKLKNLILYHKAGGGCGGQVLRILHSQNIQVEATSLNGSGEIGANLVGTDYVWFSYMSIFNNSVNAIRAYNSKHISFYESIINDNPSSNDYLFDLEFSELLFKNCSITDNQSDELLKLHDYCIGDFHPKFENCVFRNNVFNHEEFLECPNYEEDYGDECEDCETPIQLLHIEQVASFFNWFDENYRDVDEFLSYFPREKLSFLTQSDTSHKAIFDFFYNNKTHTSSYEVQYIDAITENDVEVSFTQNIVENDDYNTSKTIEHKWIISFDKNNRFYKVQEALPVQEINKNSTTIPKLPILENEDLKYMIQEFSPSILSQEYFEYYFDGSNQYYHKFAVNIVTDKLQYYFYSDSVIETYNDNKISKQDKQKLQDYFLELKKYTWRQFYNGLQRESLVSVSKYKDELLTCFEGIWRFYTNYLNDDIDFKYDEFETLIPPKIPKTENEEVSGVLWQVNKKIFSDILFNLRSKEMHRNYVPKYILNLYKEQKSRYVIFSDGKLKTSDEDTKKLNEYNKKNINYLKNVDSFLSSYFEGE